jgi:ATP-binding cassette subfamily B protein RaxB
MVATHLGYNIDLMTLRQRYPISAQGMTLTQLVKTADRLGLNGRPVRLELQELGDLDTPCILHWELKHFVVLERVARDGAYIIDPGFGRRKIDWKTLSTHFSGVALEISPGADFEPRDERKTFTLMDFWPQIAGAKGVIAQMLALSLILQILSLASPFYMQLVVDEAITGQDLDLLKALALGFLLVGFIQLTLSTLRSWIGLYVGNLLSFQLASNLFRHLMGLPADYFKKRHLGDVISRFGSFEPIKSFLTSGFVGMGLDGVLALSTLILMFIYSPMLSWFVLLAVALVLSIKMMLFTPSRMLNQEAIVLSASEDTLFMESVRAIQTVKLSGNGSARHNLWQNKYMQALNAGAKLGKLGIASGVALSSIGVMENILIVYVGAKLVIGGDLSVGMLYAFLAYAGQFRGSAIGLVDALISMKMLSVHLDRLADIVLSEPEVPKGQQASFPQGLRLRGKLTLHKVTYAHSPLDKPVINSVSLVVNPGESVALVGPSGCGKTTLIKLMVGLARPNQGQILVDGIPLTPHFFETYWSQIGVVLQDDQLVSGTIGENIILKTGALDTNKMHLVARVACIYDEIMAMPMGFNTLIGDMGSALSGGQKQRVLLARALYGKPRILFLDEATSHLDTRLEERIARHLSQLKITRVMIAHRPQSMALCDRVLRLKSGLLTEKNMAGAAEQIMVS